MDQMDVKFFKSKVYKFKGNISNENGRPIVVIPEQLLKDGLQLNETYTFYVAPKDV